VTLGAERKTEAALEFGTTPDQDQAILPNEQKRFWSILTTPSAVRLLLNEQSPRLPNGPRTTRDWEQTVDIRVDLHPINSERPTRLRASAKRSRRNQGCLTWQISRHQQWSMSMELILIIVVVVLLFGGGGYWGRGRGYW
jgi:hypothetical protein